MQIARLALSINEKMRGRCIPPFVEKHRRDQPPLTWPLYLAVLIAVLMIGGAVWRQQSGQAERARSKAILPPALTPQPAATDIERLLLAFFRKPCFVKEGGRWASLHRNSTHRVTRKPVELNLAIRKEEPSELLVNSIYRMQRPFVVVRKLIKFDPHYLAGVVNSHENGSTISV